MPHTPGPWRALGQGVYPDCDGLRTLATIAICKRRQMNPRINKREAEANARLIASAPRLLAALKRAERFIDEEPELSEVRAAIAEAEEQ